MRHRLAVGVWIAVGGLVPARAGAAPPAAPTGVHADNSVPGQITLTWNASAGATSYRVYRDVDPLVEFRFPAWQFVGSPSPVGTPTDPTFLDSGLPRLVRQFYVVTAVNGSDEESPLGSLGSLPPMVETRVTAPPDAPVFGFADMHSHQFANEAFGGQFLWGKAFGPPAQALGPCGGLGVGIHGLGGLGDVIGNALRGTFPLGHFVEGYDHFDGWPYWNDYTHQQMHADWLKRAYDGGLRLLVVHAVNDKLLCQLKGPATGLDCEDMPAVDRQIAAAKAMEGYIDGQWGGPGQGWYRIAYSATEARHIINSGKLAVVLGIEVDELFGCGMLGSCTDQHVVDQLNYYYDQGVRHLFPVHLFNNLFGGAAMYDEFFNYGNKVLTGGVTGHFFDPTACPEGQGYQYKLENPTFLFSLLGFVTGLGSPTPTDNPADCNERGLTPLGETLVRQMMRKHMILDIDHMSAATLGSVPGTGVPGTGALGIAGSQGYPVVAGHTGIVAASSGQKAHEGQKSDVQLQGIRGLHGMVAPILRQGSTQEISFSSAGVPNDCGQSSKSWAQAYQATVAAMGGPGTAAVGLGSDFNGMAGELAPRFGPEHCAGDETAPQGGGVPYPFAIEAPPGVPAGGAGHLDRFYYGLHTHNDGSGAAAGYDYNFEGLAHVGLLPDFVADLRSFMPANALQPLFRSAEAYLQVWERVERTQVFPPSVAAVTLPADAATAWQPGDVTVTITATPNPQGSSNLSIRYSAQGATTLPQTVVPGTVASVTLTNEGATTLTFDAVDEFGSAAAGQTLTVRIDRTAPQITCASPFVSWLAQNVALGCGATDVLSGLANAGDATFTLETTVASGAETADAATGSRPVADAVGNTATAGPISGNKIDRKPPAIDVSLSGTGTYLIHQAATVTYSCTDGGSGVASCRGIPASGESLDTATPGVKTVAVSATDQVGNASSSNTSYTVAFNICPLYDPGKIKKTGSTIPVKLQACDAAAANLSRPDLLVTATGVRMVSSSTVGVLDDSGEANPDFNFRYDPSLAGYIFNLSTKGLAPGSWQLVFRIAGDPTDHTALFQLR